MSNPTFTLQSTLRRVDPLGALSAALRSVLNVTRRDAPNPAARDAEALRQLANRYRDSDRGFAADLYVAADRHEQIARAQRPRVRSRPTPVTRSHIPTGEVDYDGLALR